MTSSAFDTGLPSIRQIQNLIRDKKTVEVKLMTGDTLAGAVSWQDANAVCVKDANGARHYFDARGNRLHPRKIGQGKVGQGK